MIILFLLFSFSAFSFTDYEDLLSWKHVPQKALDEHRLWKNVYLIKAQTPQGEEMRVYVNRVRPDAQSSCYKRIEGLGFFDPQCVKEGPCLKSFNGKYPEMMEYLKCSRAYSGCDNIFIIKDQMVQSYQPVGHCTTTSKLRPDEKYLNSKLH